MIRIDIRNDGTGSAYTGNYDIQVSMPHHSIENKAETFKYRHEGHPRVLGWKWLIKEWAKELK